MALDPTGAQRIDFAGYELSKPYPRDGDGAVHYHGVAAREGILSYRRADGTEWRELVTKQAVIDTAALVARAAMVNNHPTRKDGSPLLVNPDNFGDLAVGDVDGEAEVVEDAQGAYARVKFTLRRRDALDAAKGGKAELSPAYQVKLDMTPGVDERFGRYDASQVGRERVNHLAIVDKARGGSTVRFRLDSGDVLVSGAGITTGRGNPASERSTQMKPSLVSLLTLLGVTRLDDEDQALADGLGIVKDRADAEEGKGEMIPKAKYDEDMATKDEELAKLKADMKALKSKADAADLAEQARVDAAEATRLDGILDTLKLDAADGADLETKKVALAAHALRMDSAKVIEGGDAFISAGVRAAEAMAEAAKGAEAARVDDDNSNLYTLKRRDSERGGGEVPAPINPWAREGDKFNTSGGAS